MEKSKLRVMIDTNVLISGLIVPRYAFEILNLAFKQEINLFLSETVIRGAKIKIQEKFPNFFGGLGKFLSNCPFELISDTEDSEVKKNQGLIRDKSDIPITLSAIQAKIDFFITGDKDFLEDSEVINKLKKHFTILSPTAFLKQIINWSDENLDKIRQRKW